MTVTTDTSNMADTIDTRDIIERVAELDDLIDAEREDWEVDEKLALLAERALLRDQLLVEIDGAEDGVTLIRDSYFKEYAMELADELGTYDHDLKWPLTCIDWNQAARELRYDYSAVDYDGVTYWFQS